MKQTAQVAKARVHTAAKRTRHNVILSDTTLEISTAEPIEFVDITDFIEQHLAEHDVDAGTVTVFSRHTTAAIKINEAEELLIEDFKTMLREMFPPGRDYNHNDMNRRKPPIAPDERPNGHSHCMHLMLSTSETIPVVDGRLALGTWQRVFVVELDGPRHREVIIRCEAYHPHDNADSVGLHALERGTRTNGRNGGTHRPVLAK
jgi:secondary thiamine-phosphate synthase enzyme